MAGVNELIEKIQNNPELQNEVSAMLADGKVSMQEVMAFATKYGSQIPFTEIPQLIEKLKGLKK